MGMIMNRFDMLSKMREAIRTNNPSAEKYRQFVLTGVIVHDPVDRELYQLIQQRFSKWSKITGSRFLFITFVSYPKDMSEPHDYSFNSESLILESSMTEEDECQISSLLRRFFGLPSAGSYLVLSENISSVSFSHIPINTETLQRQLVTITTYCETPYSQSPADYQALLQQLKGQNYTHDKALLDFLIDTTAFTSPPHQFYQKQKKHIDALYESEMLKIRHKIENMQVMEKYSEDLYYEKRADYTLVEELNEKMFQLFQAIAMALKKFDIQSRYEPNFSILHLNHSRNIIDKETDSDYDVSLLSDYSYSLYRSYLLLRDYVRARNPSRFDFSGLTTYFCKILENELHLSICQMLRQVKGIPIPKYFNLFCDTCGPVDIKTGNGHIAHLNYYDPSQANVSINRRQMTVPIGILLNAYEKVKQSVYNGSEDVIREYFREVNDNLIQFCERFNNYYRNPTSHIDYFSFRTYRNASRDFDEFFNCHLPELASLRKQLEPRHTTIYRHNEIDY